MLDSLLQLLIANALQTRLRQHDKKRWPPVVQLLNQQRMQGLMHLLHLDTQIYRIVLEPSGSQVFQMIIPVCNLVLQALLNKRC